MPLPRTKTNVPRDRANEAVELMLMNPGVGDVDCMEQTDHRYTVRPRPRVASLATSKKTRRKRSRKKANG